MARDYNKQTIWSYNGLAFDFGHQTFSTTDATLNIYTRLDVIKGFTITPVEAMTTPETFTISGINDSAVTADSIVNGEMRTDNGYVTITRAGTPVVIENTVEGPVSSYNLLEAPIGVCPVAGTMTALYWYSGVIAGGSPLMEVGKVPTYGAGTADQDWFVDSADDATSSHVPPASSVGKSIITLTAAAGGHTAVAAGDLITISTTGAGSSNPSGTYLRAVVTPTPTSALDIYYMFWGY